MRVLFVLRKAPIMRTTISRLVLVDAQQLLDAQRFVASVEAVRSNAALSNAVLTHAGPLKRGHETRACGTQQAQDVGLHWIAGLADVASLADAVSHEPGYLPQMRCALRATLPFEAPYQP